MTLTNGKQVALEGDYCVCKCDPSPVLIASRDNMYMTMSSDELSHMGYASDGTSLEMKSAALREVFDRCFRFVDENGQPVSGIRVHLTGVDARITLVHTDSNGRTPVLSGEDGQRIGVRLTARA
jgi:hypothetical protein